MILALPADLLGFQRTVPRWQVHRRAVSEVFVCESRTMGLDEFAVSVQMPRAHLLWSDRVRGYHDCLMAVEAGRQALIMLCHAHYGMAVDMMMIARSSTVRVCDREAFRDDGATPLEGAFAIRLVDKVMRHDVPVSMTFEGDLLLAGANEHDGTKAMSMGGTLVFTRKEDYEFLRAQSRVRKQLNNVPARGMPDPLAMVAPALVGRRIPGNVVIADEPGFARTAEPDGHLARHRIVVDQANPCFFDHPLDHVPGHLLVEACRQSAIVTAVRDRVLPGPACMVTACGVSFDDFVELDAMADCTVTEVSPADAGTAGTAETARVLVSVRQFGMPVGEVELELAALPPACQPA
jgi:hypothetical protein